MQARQPNLLTRDDTFFGICQALGEDLGFPPNLLRIALGIPLIFSPLAVLTVYFGLGAIVLISRILAPRPRRKLATQAEAEAAAPAAANEEQQLPLPIAA